MSYATSGQLATFTGSTAPADADRLLTRASELIDDHIAAALYDVDSQGVPTAQPVIDALANATCAQVEFWLTGDEEEDILGPLESASIGGMGQGYGSTNRVTPMYLAPRAARLLRNAGLLYAGVGSTSSQLLP